MITYRYPRVFRSLILVFTAALVVSACAADSTGEAVVETTAGPDTGGAASHIDEVDEPASDTATHAEVGEAHANEVEERRDAAATGDSEHHAQATQAEDSAAETAHEGSRVVEVVMTEFAFEPDQLTVTAGETITFVVSNEGVVPHELRFSNAHRIEEHLASGHEGHDEGGGHHGDADVFVLLDPGAAADLTVTFPEDATFFTEMACLIEGHYEAGMKGLLVYD